jgi:hypothetical protein
MAILAPRILSCFRQFQVQRLAGPRRRVWPAMGAWSLLAVEDGSLSLGPDSVRLGPGNAALNDGSAASGYTETRRGRYRRLEFDVVQRPLLPQTRSPLDWRPQDPDSVQPSGQELWGLAMPLTLPKSLHLLTVNMVREVTDLWWRGRREQTYCDLLLAGWLARLYASVALVPDTAAAAGGSAPCRGGCPTRLRRRLHGRRHGRPLRYQ